jgi:hypothetical protein
MQPLCRNRLKFVRSSAAAASAQSPTSVFVSEAIEFFKSSGMQSFVSQVNKEHSDQFILPSSLTNFVELYADALKPPPLHKFQQFLSHVWHLHHAAVCRSEHHYDEHLTATITACSQKWASGWLTCLPTRADLRMENHVYRYAVCLRLNTPPVNLFPAWKQNLLCADCDTSLVQNPFHRIHCPAESPNGRRVQHNHVNKKFANFVDLCGHQVQIEPSSFLDPTTKKRPDGLIRLNDGGNMIYDVRGFDSLAPSYIDKDMKKVLADASKEKLDKYKTHGRVVYPNIEMKPFVFDTLSGLSDPAIRLMKVISRKGHLSSARGPEKIVLDAIAAISVAIQVDNAAIVQKSFGDARPR